MKLYLESIITIQNIHTFVYTRYLHLQEGRKYLCNIQVGTQRGHFKLIILCVGNYIAESASFAETDYRHLSQCFKAWQKLFLWPNEELE
jgi:hypothetical protein